MKKAVGIDFKISIMRFLVFAVCFTFLFLGFYRNEWQMVGQKKFSLFQKDVEGYVIARMVLTRQSGLFSNGGLLGWGDVNLAHVTEADYQNQYDTYLHGLSFQTYLPKMSHPGFQGIFFSILDQLSPFSASNNLRLFRMFASALFAATLAGLIIWFLEELGRFSGFFVFASIISSQWMTLFGRNLFFVSGFFFLPMLVLLFRLRNEKRGIQFSNRSLFWLVFLFILLKCLFNGYDFILPTLCMVATPIVFYGVLDNWDSANFIRRIMIVIMASISAVLASLLVLSIQVMFASGSFQGGINYIIETVNRRTLSNDPNLPIIYEQANKASLGSILEIYLSESYFYSVFIPYYGVMILFAVASSIGLIAGKRQLQETSHWRSALAMVAATWFSLLGVLSWYTIFKSLAYFHTHMNYLPWHMPFTLFGFGMCGYFVDVFYRSAIKKNTNATPLH